jgi:imidazolonepropionase-like amidohydrolase
MAPCLGGNSAGGGLILGAPADAVVYDADPRTDLALLDTPRAVILRGRLIYG